MNEKYDLFGKVEPDRFGMILGTGYMRFSNPHGVDGLFRINGNRLNILAIYTNLPRTGQLREFINHAKEKFDTICFWIALNSDIGTILGKYGFTQETEIDGSGEVIEGFRWDK